MSASSAPTLAAVAEMAGVSIATASRALSGTKPVSADAVLRIQEACRVLGYRHNAVASALRSKRSGTIGLLLPRYSTGFLSTLIEAVSAALDRQGLSIVLRYIEPDALTDNEHIESLLARQVDGIILCPPTEAASRASISAAGNVPVVQVGRHIDTDHTDSVGLDDARATALLITHLAEREVHSLSVVGLNPDVASDAHRLVALGAAAARFGITVAPPITAAPTVAGGIAAAELLVTAAGAELSEMSDAIVCVNDDVANGLLAVLRMEGVAVPEQVQVCSLLDVSFGEDNEHKITTLRHPWPAMGREAVRLLLDDLTPDPLRIARRVVLAPQLVLGASTRSLG